MAFVVAMAHDAPVLGAFRNRAREFSTPTLPEPVPVFVCSLVQESTAAMVRMTLLDEESDSPLVLYVHSGHILWIAEFEEQQALGFHHPGTPSADDPAGC